MTYEATHIAFEYCRDCADNVACNAQEDCEAYQQALTEARAEIARESEIA